MEIVDQRIDELRVHLDVEEDIAGIAVKVGGSDFSYALGEIADEVAVLVIVYIAVGNGDAGGGVDFYTAISGVAFHDGVCDDGTG